MRRHFLTLALATAAVVAGAQTIPAPNPNPCSVISTGAGGAFNSFVMFPNDAWHQDISTAAVDPNSANILAGIGSSHIQQDFGTFADNYGIPYIVVDHTTSTPQLMTQWPSASPNYPPLQSDVTYWPIPNNHALPIEGAPAASDTDPNAAGSTASDQHALILDKDSCVLYEAWKMQENSSGSYEMVNGAIWDLTLNSEGRPLGETSADAGGLSVLEGLIRYDEIVAGVINHAIRFTTNVTKSDANGGPFISPASHAAGGSSGSLNIPGMRLRLQASFDISTYPSDDQIILTAMKKYGMILADNGTSVYFQGATDNRWNDTDLNLLKNVPITAFDVIQEGTLVDEQSDQSQPAPGTTVPTGTITASAMKVAQGTPVTLSVTSTGDMNFVTNAGFVRSGSSITVTPQQTTTYTLETNSSYQGFHATPLGSVTVEVSPTSASFDLGSVHVLAGYNFPLSVTCTFADGSVLPCPATFSASAGTLTGNVFTEPVGSATITSTYGGLTLTNTLTAVPSPPKFAGHMAVSGKN